MVRVKFFCRHTRTFIEIYEFGTNVNILPYSSHACPLYPGWGVYNESIRSITGIHPHQNNKHPYILRWQHQTFIPLKRTRYSREGLVLCNRNMTVFRFTLYIDSFALFRIFVSIPFLQLVTYQFFHLRSSVVPLTLFCVF